MVFFLEYCVFLKQFFTQNNPKWFRMDFDMFFGILIFDPKCGFCMGYSLCMMTDFQSGLIFLIFGIF